MALEYQRDQTAKPGENLFGTTLPAPMANHFSFLVGPGYIRIACGEGFGTGDMKDTNWHTAIVVPYDDARQLGEMLVAMATRIAAERAAASEPPQKASPNA